MKFKPEEPFEVYDIGYEYFNSFVGRYQVALSCTGSNFSPVTMFRSRYRYCVFLGYVLPSHIHVDHIDEDRANDEIYNLQTLTARDNTRKYFDFKRNYRPMVETYFCSECGNSFNEDHGVANSRKKMSKSGDLYCTMACSIKARAKINTLSVDEQNKIKELRESGKSIEEVTAITGYCANAVLKYQGSHIRLNAISPEKVKQIEELSKTNISNTKIGELLNIGRQTVARYRK